VKEQLVQRGFRKGSLRAPAMADALVIIEVCELSGPREAISERMESARRRWRASIFPDHEPVVRLR